MKLAITVCATKSYAYAMQAQARRVSSALRLASVTDAHVFIVGDTSKELKDITDYWSRELVGHTVELIASPRFVEGGENYKKQAQLLIADMRTEAHAAARRIDADWCWSLDSDTLPQANALRVLLDTCRFDGGYYSVAMCPYPNAAFLGGFGTPMNPIAEDFLPHERKLPEWLKKAWERSKTWEPNTKNAAARHRRLMERIKRCPPDGNVFEVNGKHGWRRRGWLENAYPGIGLGATVPTDWVGFGCTLMNKQALGLAHFEGYDGQGTEDLFIGWHRWIPAGLRMAVVPHCPADHVIWSKKKGGDAGEYTLHHVFHEQIGECYGHLRTKQTPWRSESE